VRTLVFGRSYGGGPTTVQTITRNAADAAHSPQVALVVGPQTHSMRSSRAAPTTLLGEAVRPLEQAPFGTGIRNRGAATAKLYA
jgi:hypothetical protein